MGVFEAFRDPGWNTYHPDRPRPFPFDVTTAIVTYLAAVLVAAVLMVVIGTRGRERWTTFFRLLLSLHTGVVIIYCIVGTSWQVSEVSSHTQYSAELPDGIYARVGIQIGLKSLNITLTANQSISRSSGEIHYNEMFSFNHVRDIRDNYHEALERGLPFPIVYTLEYFSVDAGGLRWHRAVRTGGHFTYILLWTSLLSWCIANVLLCFAPSRGLFMLTLTGVLMVTAVIVYHAIQPAMLLTIPFEDAVLRLGYGWSFWLCFAAGLLASVSGISLLCLHAKFPLATNSIFLIDYSQLVERADGGAQFDYSPGPLKIDTPFSRRMNRILFVGGGEKSSSTLSLSSSIGAGVVNLETSGPSSATAMAAAAAAAAASVAAPNSAIDEFVGGLTNEAFAIDDHVTSTYRKTPDVDTDCDVHSSPPTPASRVSSQPALSGDVDRDVLPVLFTGDQTTQHDWDDIDATTQITRKSHDDNPLTTATIEQPPRYVEHDSEYDDDDEQRLDRQTVDESMPSRFRHHRGPLKRHHHRLPHRRSPLPAADADDSVMANRPLESHHTVQNLSALGEDMVESIC